MDDHPHFYDEMRERVAKASGRPIRDAEWFYLLQHGFWPQDATTAFPGEPDTQARFLADEIRKFRAAGLFAFGRAPGARRASPSYTIVALSPDESLMSAAVSDAMAARAAVLPEVQYVHRTMPMRPDQAERFWSEEGGLVHPALIDHVTTLAIRFGWDPAYAAGFAFAGATPMVEPLRASISVIDVPDEYDPTRVRSRARVLLEADPLLSERTLLTAFRALRKEVIGGDQHLPTPQQLEVFRFVVWRLDERGQPRKDAANPKGSWQAIGRQWNAEHKDDGWRYKRDDYVKKAFDAVNKKLVARRIVLDGEDEISLDVRAQGREHGKQYISFVDFSHRSPRDRFPKKARGRQTIAPDPG
jgi:hypothetical protein